MSVDDSPAASASASPPISDAELVTRALLREARRARSDLALFYSFVMRHEFTKQRLICAPHQRLAISFIEAHPLCVLRLPVGTGKTYLTAATALWKLGNDVTQRAAIVSKSEGQAMKPLAMVSDYITEPSLAAGLALVFPWLKRSMRVQDSWAKTGITVERPAGIRDPSLKAAGLDSASSGSRWSFLVADDLIDDENCLTRNGREKVESRFNGRLLSRLDPDGGSAVVTNTPWDRDDLTYYLENTAMWPTLTMDIYGFIRFSNATASWIDLALNQHIRPSMTRGDDNKNWYRLRAHDPDLDEQIPLWPARYSVAKIAEIRYGREGKGGFLPHDFARLYLCEPMDPTTNRCQRGWIEACKRRGLGKCMVHRYDGPYPTYTGVDLGVGPGKKHDKTVFFTFARHKDGSRELLNVKSDKIDGPTIVKTLIDHVDRYGSVVRVETNAAQKYLMQFAMVERKDLQIQAHSTGPSNKYDRDFGVESLFTEFKNESWIIPCNSDGKCDPEIQAFIDDCVYYQPPPAHTGDHLMAAWLGREASRRGSRGNLKASNGRIRELIAQGGY